MHEKRQTVATMPTAELPRFQHALMKTLVDLDGIVLAMEQEFARSKHADAAASNHFLATMPAATPTVEAMAYANARDAYAEQAALPGLWKAQAARNRALRALVDPVAAADVRGNVIDLLDYAEEVYGLAEHEALEDKGPKHRRRGRPKKRQEVKTK